MRAPTWTLATAVALVVTGAAGCSSSPARPPAPGGSAGRPGALVAPKTSTVQDTEYLTDVARADPELATYLTDGTSVAERAVLTDGLAFCAFLQRDRDLDTALVSVAQGAQGVESQTHLPSDVTTFNTIEAVSLLTLCPAEQEYLPAAARARIQALGRQLSPGKG